MRPHPRRGTDRVEDAAAWFLMSLGLMLVIVAVLVGVGVHADELERARGQQVTRVEVVAVLVVDAPVAISEYNGARPYIRATARWTGADGVPCEGPVPVWSGAPAGTEVRIWVDRDCRVRPAPTNALNALMAGVMGAFAVMLVGGMTLGGVWSVVRRATAARNATHWEREWARVGPEWTRHPR